MNTNCSARFAFRVPKNIAKVNMPHMKKYAAIDASVGAANPVIRMLILAERAEGQVTTRRSRKS